MRVLLVDPPHEIFKFFRGRMPAPSLTALTAYIEKDFEVEVIDCTVQDRPWAALEDKVREFRPQVVGITAISTSYIYDAMNAAYLVKQVDPSIITVGGGVHMSLVTEETFEKCPSIDYIVRGEGELTLMEFLKAVEAGKTDLSGIPGLAFRNDGGVHVGPERELIDDLDTLPLPAYHKFPMHKYMMPSLGMATHNSIVLTTARGCGGVCNYCSEAKLWRSTWRAKSAARVLDEMELLYRDHNKFSFMFGDNSFNWERQRVEDFIAELEKRRLPVHFWFQTRAEHILRDADLLPRLKKLGLYMISMGVETPSETALKNYRKKQTAQTSLDAMKLIKSNGLLLITNIMFGDIDDTEQTLQDTIDFAKPYSDHFAICLTTPLPGTDYFKRAKEQGRIKVWDYSKFDMLNPVMETRTLSIERLAEIHPKAIEKFYSRFRVFWDAFFSTNPYLRKNNRFFVKVAWEVITHKPWVQKNYVPFEKYMEDKTGKPFDRLHF
jgi:anaerobic magnesium-protoporphyrin IX monomethyl ester cyclase